MDDQNEWVEADTTTYDKKEKKHRKDKERKDKDKKHKKDKDKKKRKHSTDSSSDDDSDKDKKSKHQHHHNDHIVEKKSDINGSTATSTTQDTTTSTSTSNRDEWMSLESSSWLSGTRSHNEINREAKNKIKEDKQSLSAAMLSTAGLINPDQLTGDGSHLLAKKAENTTATPQTTTSVSNVGDGGAGWRAKKLLRAQQQANEMGVPLEQVLRERYDESEVQSLLNQVKNTPSSSSSEKRHQHSNNSNSSHNESQRRNEPIRDYLKKSDKDEDQHMFQKPSEHSSLRWGSRSDSSSSSSSYRDKYDSGSRRDDRDRRDDNRRDDKYRRDDRDDRDYKRDDRRDTRRDDRDYKRDDRDDNRHRRDDKRYNDDYKNDRRDYSSRDDRDHNNTNREEKRIDKEVQKPPTIEIVRTEQPKLSDYFPQLYKEKQQEKQEERKQDIESAEKEHKESTSSTTTTTTSSQPPLNINKLSGEMMKAKLQGNMEKYESLKKQIDQLKASQNNSSSNQNNTNQNSNSNNNTNQSNQNNNQKVKVSGLDEFGKKIFMDNHMQSSKQMGAARGTGGSTKIFDKKGERLQYYADDDNYTLEELVQREKKGLGGDIDMELVKTMSNAGNWATDDREDFGPDMHNIRGGASKRKLAEQQERQVDKFKQKIINADKKVNSILDRCWYCYSSTQFQRHMMVSTGNHLYLSLPTRGSLGSGHCTIIPIQHVLSCRMMDEEALDELNNFKKCLIQMFDRQDKGVVFIETAMKFKQQYHCVVECIPIDHSHFTTAPAFFKKSLMESESEWSNNKLIDSVKKGGIKNCVPESGFPYFWVEFGYKQVGMVHPIEDEVKFPRDFGKSIIAGMLELDMDEIHSRRKSKQDEEFIVSQFKKKWDPFDWTKGLN